MRLDTLRDLYINELNDLHSAETQLLEALAKMAGNSVSPALQKAFADHLAETEVHAERLEQIFDSLDVRPGGKKSKAIGALIDEGEALVDYANDDYVLDALLISKAQHMEHYEIAGYGTVRAFALVLGESEHADLLQKTLNEEIAADRLLTKIAERSINRGAAGEEAASGEMARPTSRLRRERQLTRVPASDRSERKSPRRHITGSGRRSSKDGSRETRDR